PPQLSLRPAAEITRPSLTQDTASRSDSTPLTIDGFLAEIRARSHPACTSDWMPSLPATRQNALVSLLSLHLQIDGYHSKIRIREYYLPRLLCSMGNLSSDRPGNLLTVK